MAKILGNDVVTTQEFNEFNASVIIPLVNKNRHLTKIVNTLIMGTVGSIIINIALIGYIILK